MKTYIADWKFTEGFKLNGMGKEEKEEFLKNWEEVEKRTDEDTQRIFKSIKKQALEKVKNLSQEEKEEILEYLQKEYS